MLNVPEELTIGDTWEWTDELSEYPAPTWTLNFHLVNSGGVIQITASASGEDHASSVLPATTSGYTAGRYRWAAQVTDGTDTFTIEKGWVEILPDPTIAQDARSQARRTLDAIEAVLEGRATRDDLNVSVNGRAISRIPIPELLQWRDRLKEEVRVQEEGAGSGFDRDVRVRFDRV